MKIMTNKKISILISLICLFFVSNLYSQTYKVDKKESSSQDLAYYSVTDKEFEYKVYFDSINEKAASRAISYLNKLYDEILKSFKVKNGLSKWADVAFVNDEGYKSPAYENTRWVIQNQKTDGLSNQAKKEIYSIIVHEQVHALQRQFENCKSLPRWFKEGQAIWIESRVLSHLTPKEWDKSFNKLKKISEDKILNEKMTPLENWGGMGFSIEAIKRQLTPVGIEYLEKHGTTPPGVTLSFKPTDFNEEGHNLFSHAVNYYKSYLIFKSIQDNIGTKVLIDWNKDILNECYTTNEIVNSLKEKYNVDITEKLKK